MPKMWKRVLIDFSAASKFYIYYDEAHQTPTQNQIKPLLTWDAASADAIEIFSFFLFIGGNLMALETLWIIKHLKALKFAHFASLIFHNFS